MELPEQRARYFALKARLDDGSIDRAGVALEAQRLQRDADAHFSASRRLYDHHCVAGRKIQHLRIEVSRLANGLPPCSFRI